MNNASNITGIIPLESSGCKHVITSWNDIALMMINGIIMLAMGATVSPKHLAQCLRKPWSVIVGICTQTVLLPLITFSLVEVTRLKTDLALSALILSCAPGGPLSNALTHWAGGDVTLSLCLTIFCSLLSLGSMPLNLWLYARYFQHQKFRIPYCSVVIALAGTLIFVFFGILIKWKLPRVAPVVTKIGSFVAGLVISVSIVLHVCTMPLADNFMGTSVWLLVIFFPLFCFLFGYLAGAVCGRTSRRCKTIAIEVGCQNIGIAWAISRMSLHGPASIFPSFYGLFASSNAIVIIILYRLHRIYKNCVKCCKRRADSNVTEEDLDEAHDITSTKCSIANCCKRTCCAIGKWCTTSPDYEDDDDVDSCCWVYDNGHCKCVYPPHILCCKSRKSAKVNQELNDLSVESHDLQAELQEEVGLHDAIVTSPVRPSTPPPDENQNSRTMLLENTLQHRCIVHSPL